MLPAPPPFPAFLEFTFSLFLFWGMMTSGASAHPSTASESSHGFSSAGFVQDDSRLEQAQELFRLSRLDAFTRNTTSNIQEILLDLTSQQDDESFLEIIIRAFQQDLLETVLLRSLTRNIREPAASETIAHLSQTDIGVLMALLYDNSTDFDDPETAEAFEAYLLEADLRPEAFENRIALLSEILRISQTARITVQSLEDVLTIVIFALNQSNPDEQRLSDREVNDLIISLRLNFRQLFDNVLLSVAFFATREVSEDVLEKHLSFLSSDSGGWFIRTYNNAVLNGFGEISEQVAAGLAKWAIEQAEEVDDDDFED